MISHLYTRGGSKIFYFYSISRLDLFRTAVRAFTCNHILSQRVTTRTTTCATLRSRICANQLYRGKIIYVYYTIVRYKVRYSPKTVFILCTAVAESEIMCARCTRECSRCNGSRGLIDIIMIYDCFFFFFPFLCNTVIAISLGKNKTPRVPFPITTLCIINTDNTRIAELCII